MRQIELNGEKIEVRFTFRPGRFPQRQWNASGVVQGVPVSGSGNSPKRAYREFIVEARREDRENA